MRKNTSEYVFSVEGEAVGKGRPRFTKKGYAYTPKKTRDYEKEVRIEFLQKYGYVRSKYPISMSIEVYVEPPKSVSKKKREELIESGYPTKKPDCDNIVKIIGDALNEVAYEDDKQVVEINMKKRYAEESKVIITLKEIN